MIFIQNPAYILAVLLLLVVAGEWLTKKKLFHRIGSALIVILLAAILANIGIIPSSHNAPPLYNGIFEYAAPLGIFFLLLDVKLKDLKLAGWPMLIMFLLGSATTIVGVIIGYYLFSPQHHHINQAYAVAGMYTGTYIGGSANLNAVALEYGVTKDGTLFAAINAVDNIVTTPWIMATLFLPAILQRFFPRKRKIPPEADALKDEELRDRITGNAQISIIGIASLLTLGFGTLFISRLITDAVPQIPSILILTTIALILAQIPFVQKIKGGKLLGYLLILIFLAVVGTFCDINALLKSGEVAGVLLIWVTVLVLIHGFLLILIAGLFKQDWDIVAIASNANIGGATTAAVCATSLGRKDLQLPGLLVGSVGNAIGTYLGIMVAEFLK
jgi:uncharacterized membrane protein